jgi:hypothetical protein
MRIEKVTGYNGDGFPVTELFIDGVRVDVDAVYELDPDDRLGRAYDTAAWLDKQSRIAEGASPAAAALIRKWAAETAEHGCVDPDDDEVTDAD